eukprot:XP_011616910.1 PREDICTED: pleckstrin homology domain-containing family G member 3 [Takifugu rubripes]
MAPNLQLTYLDRVLMEIIETERMYVRDLRMIVEDYLAHIIDQCELLIGPEQVCALFGNIEDIYEFNSELLQALDLCDNDAVAVARCFIMKGEFFEIYTQYCTNYPNSVAALTECMRKKSLATFFRERQASLKCSLPLGSYLLKPVQRILKYHLLLQEIAKHFDPEEQGYEVVEEAIYTMTSVAWYINDMKRKHEHAIRLQEVQSLLLNWKGPDLTTYGELVLEGTFKVHRAKNERTLFLFDRVLLITKRRGEHFVYKAHIFCSTLMLIESAKDSLSFSVTHYKHPKQPHTVQAKTVEERKLWAHHIKRIILENHRAIIPQKAKDAIMELQPIYAPRYRHSPERTKKVLSCPSDVQQEDCQERPRSAVFPDLLVGVNNLNKQLPEDASNGTEASSEQATTDVLLLQKSEQEEEEAAEEEPPSQPESLDGTHHSESPRSFEDQTSDRDSESAGTPSSAPESNPVLSSEESSEDEEGMNDGGEAGGRTPSILPSSVLDRAGAIAQHFTNSIRRASLAQDEVRFLGCASPRLPGRPNTLRTEPAEGASGVTTEAPETMVTDLTSPSSREDGVFDGNRDSRRRRDSTLSTQDQLLLSKIKSYYDNAESQSPTFCLQRRESLTYIPAGLVRSSITRINSIPKADSMETTSSVTNSGPSSSLATESQDLLDSSQSLDTLSFDLKGIEDSRKSQRSPFQHSQDSPSEEEEFIPSSQMIRIWQNMEQEMTLTQKEKKISTLQEAPQNSRASHKVSDSIKVQTKDSHPESQDLQTEKVFNKETLVLRPPVHQVSQAKPETGGGSTCEDDMEQANSKVLHLARQYSQKIKTAKPVVRQRSQGLLLCKNRLPCVVEELEKTEISEKPKLDLNNSAVPPPLSHPAKVRSASSSLLCKEKMISRDQAQSCTSVNHSSSSSNEAFNWPDVQQLRSKYCNRSNSQKHVVSPANFTPDHVSRRRHSSCSSCLLPEGDALKVPSFKSGDTWETKAGESRRRLQRAGSLDLRLRNTGMTEAATQQEELTDLSRGGYFVAAKAPLPNDPEHCVIVMEKVLQPVEKSTEAEDEDNYIQIRSPTSKEKISIMAVIDRCRVYQDSDQYREGEEVKVRTEVARVPGDEESQEPKTKQKENGTHNVVKNLREKFQNMS